MEYIVAYPDPEFQDALWAFANQLVSLPDPRDPQGRLFCAGSWSHCWWRWPPSRMTTKPDSGCGCLRASPPHPVRHPSSRSWLLPRAVYAFRPLTVRTELSVEGLTRVLSM